jgi:cell division protein FtsL
MDKAHLRRALHVAAALLVVVLVIGLYKAKTDAAKTEAHVRQLQTRIEDSQADMRALRAEIATLESPGHVESMAQQHLGLVVGGENAARPASAIERDLPAPRANQTGDQ